MGSRKKSNLVSSPLPLSAESMCSDSLRTQQARAPFFPTPIILPNAFYAGWCSYQPFDVNSSGVEIIMWVLSRFISNVNLLLRPRRQSGFRSKKQQLWVDWQRTPFWEWFSIQPRLRGKTLSYTYFFIPLLKYTVGLPPGHGSWSLKNSLQGNIILPPYGLHNCLFRFLFATGVRKREPRLQGV